MMDMILSDTEKEILHQNYMNGINTYGSIIIKTFYLDDAQSRIDVNEVIIDTNDIITIEKT